MTVTRQAYGALVALLVLAFSVAAMLQDSGLLSRIPPVSPDVPTPTPDVAEGAEYPLYLSAFTAWAALLLLLPVYATVWRSDQQGRAIWLSYWTVSWIAYVVHLLVAMFLFFQGDFAWMTSSSRVSAFWPGMLIAVWWPIDILLARRQATWVIVQRLLIHVLVLVLFVGGSAVKGEIVTVQVIGWVLAISALVAALIFSRRRLRHG